VGKCKAEWAELGKAAGGAVGQCKMQGSRRRDNAKQQEATQCKIAGGVGRCKAAVDEQCKAAEGGVMQLNTMETVLTDHLNFKLGGRKK
jgi:hypothetical protein